MTILGINAKLMNDFIIIFAPVLYVNQGIMKRGSVLTQKGIDFT